MEVKELNKKDIPDVVHVHLQAFRGFFLSELGANFLKTYYSSVGKNNRGVLLGCYEHSELLGFCAAATLSNGFNTHLIKTNFCAFLSVGVRLLFSRPRALVRLLKNFRKRDVALSDKGNYAELLSIGVNPAIQGKGVGKRLLLELEKQLTAKGIKELSLTTDFHNNDKAIRFYKSLGYEIIYDFITYPDRKMYRLIKNL